MHTYENLKRTRLLNIINIFDLKLRPAKWSRPQMEHAYAAVIGDQDQSLKREILIYITIGKTILLLKPERIDMMGFMSNCNS